VAALAGRLRQPEAAGRLGMVSIVAGIALGIYTGILLSSLGARPLWSSAALGPLFLVSGLSTGAAFAHLIARNPDEQASLLKADTVFLAVELALIGLVLVGLLTASAVHANAAALLLGGPYTAVFWSWSSARHPAAPAAAGAHGLAPHPAHRDRAAAGDRRRPRPALRHRLGRAIQPLDLAMNPRPPSPYANPYLAGIGLGLVLLAAFVIMGRGLGASGAFSSTVSWLVSLVAPAHAQANEYMQQYLGDGSTHPLKAWLVFEVIGVAAGALLSGLLAGRAHIAIEKGPRVSSAVRLLCAFAGGMLMAFGRTWRAAAPAARRSPAGPCSTSAAGPS